MNAQPPPPAPKVRSSTLWSTVSRFKIFGLATVVYFAISAAQSCHQQANLPRTQSEAFTFSNQVALCVRYPDRLYLDGDHRTGLLTLRLLDSADSPCLTETATPKASPSVTLTTNTGTTGITPAAPITLTVPQLFTMTTTDNLFFLDEESLAYAQPITLTRGEERSLRLAHSRLPAVEDGGRV